MIETRPQLPFIITSGGYDEEEGALGYLLKPFRAEELEKLVARTLNSC